MPICIIYHILFSHLTITYTNVLILIDCLFHRHSLLFLCEVSDFLRREHTYLFADPAPHGHHHLNNALSAIGFRRLCCDASVYFWMANIWMLYDKNMSVFGKVLFIVVVGSKFQETFKMYSINININITQYILEVKVYLIKEATIIHPSLCNNLLFTQYIPSTGI